MRTSDKLPKVGIVGPCASGKTTLMSNLRGIRADLRHIAQEHSYVQTMWQVIGKPEWLVYLDVSYPETLRRKKLNWTEAEYQEQIRRLQHARQHADFYLHTDGLTPEQVAQKVMEFIALLVPGDSSPEP